MCPRENLAKFQDAIALPMQVTRWSCLEASHFSAWAGTFLAVLYCIGARAVGGAASYAQVQSSKLLELFPLHSFSTGQPERHWN